MNDKAQDLAREAFLTDAAETILDCMSQPVAELDGVTPITVNHPDAARKYLRSAIEQIVVLILAETT